MKNIKLTSLAWIFMVLLGAIACQDDYLEYDFVIDGSVDGEEIWKSDPFARGFLNDAYKGVGNSLDRYDLNGEIGLAAGSDEAVSANLNSDVNILNNGSWGPSRTFDSQYDEMYTALRATNLFLENAPTSGIRPVADISDLMGEAYFLRAFYHFQLMKRYGSIIVATRSFSLENDLDLLKNSFQEVVDQIVRDADSAAHKIKEATIADQLGADKGRATKAAALALKSRALLYAASPLNNPSNDIAKWQTAADAAKAVIDRSGAKHGLLPIAQLPNVWNYGVTPTRYNKEVIFASQTINTETIDRLNAPPSYSGGQGRTNPTQNLVDAFEMKTTGRVISDPLSNYDPAKPYAGRDSRFDIFINYHGKNFRGVPIDVLPGGKDNSPALTPNRVTRTGYYLGKYMSTSASSSIKVWIHFRYAEVLLNYAEALNEAQGPVAAVYSNINLVRVRAGLPALQSSDPSANGYVEQTQAALRERIRNERRIELCFEDHRFFDLRRWKSGEAVLNQPVYGMRITGTFAEPAFERFVVQDRVFSEKMYLFPFPQAEISIATELEQNPGW